MLNAQTIQYALPTQTYAASANVVQTLRDLPKIWLGRLTHVAAFQFDCTFTPTWSVTPTVVGANNLLTQADFYDGAVLRFQGGFNHMRAKERLATGRYRFADADLAATSTNSRYFSRVLHMGPPHYAGAPTDFAIPCGILENGEIRMRWGALADFGGTVTVVTGSVKITARLVLMDELRIPPSYTFTNQTVNANDFNISGRCAYDALALFDSSSFGAFTAGDIGTVVLDLGAGPVINSIPRETLTQGFLDDFAAGDVGGVVGDPLSTNDTRNRSVNRTTPTALTAADNDLQPLLWSPPDCRISKLFTAESVARLRWDGTQTTGVLLVSRILPQNQSVVATQAQKAVGRLNKVTKGMTIKTISKTEYKGPMGEYMPWKISF